MLDYYVISELVKGEELIKIVKNVIHDQFHTLGIKPIQKNFNITSKFPSNFHLQTKSSYI